MREATSMLMGKRKEFEDEFEEFINQQTADPDEIKRQQELDEFIKNAITSSPGNVNLSIPFQNFIGSDLPNLLKE